MYPEGSVKDSSFNPLETFKKLRRSFLICWLSSLIHADKKREEEKGFTGWRHMSLLLSLVVSLGCWLFSPAGAFISAGGACCSTHPTAVTLAGPFRRLYQREKREKKRERERERVKSNVFAMVARHCCCWCSR
ncbi:hypothetical protein KY284_030166 [Solanum tuberosum]|nr:hypothetical protein KY284_030166 [Solanum tuberosum]